MGSSVEGAAATAAEAVVSGEQSVDGATAPGFDVHVKCAAGRQHVLRVEVQLHWCGVVAVSGSGVVPGAAQQQVATTAT